MRTRITNQARRAFTLIEILIVVVILGILAAIVIPQFTDASQDAMESSVRSQLQTVRSQIELYRVQNPALTFDPVTDGWDALVDGEYLQADPRNPLQPALTATAVGALVGAGVGWVWVTPLNGSIPDLFATDGVGGWFDEDGDGTPDNPLVP